MVDFLDEDDLDESLARLLATLWDAPGHRVLYGQNPGDGSIELYSNPALAAEVGRRRLDAVAAGQLDSWIHSLAAAGPLRCAAFAGQPTYAQALDAALARPWPTELRRVARQGDCQASSNYGTATEQAATGRVLQVAQEASVRRIAAVEVLGTDLVFVQANFQWDEMEIFSSEMKSCRPFGEFCELIVPQLVARKGVQAIVFLEAELEARARGASRLAPYTRLFAVQEDPDGQARAVRQLLRQRLLAFFAGSASGRSATPSHVRWLNAARQRLGLMPAAASAASTAHNEAQDLLRSYLALTQTDDEASIKRLVSSAPAQERLEGAAANIRLGIGLLASAKLGTLDDERSMTYVLREGAEQELWWSDTALALTRFWVSCRRPTGWVAALATRRPELLRQAALDSDASYDLVRAEWLRIAGQPAMLAVLPYESRDAEQSQGDSYRSLLREVKAIGERLRALPSDYEPTSNDAAAPVFYLRLTLSSQGLATAAMREMLDLARNVWDGTPWHQAAEVDYWLDQDDLTTAEQQCRRWQAEHPGDAEAWYAHGRIHARGQRYPEALACYRHSMTLADTKDNAQREVARCLWLLDRDEEAEGELRELIARTSSPPAQVLLGKIMYYSQRFEAARDVFKVLPIEEIDNHYALAPYLLSLIRTSGTNEAMQEFAEHRSRLSDEELARYVADAAVLLHDKGQSAQAVQALRGALKFNVGWEDAVLEMAGCCWAAGDLAGARDLLVRALDAPCADAEHHMQLARTYMYAAEPGQRDFARSFRIAAQGLQAYPQSFGLWNQAGEAAAFAGESDKPYFERVVALVGAIPDNERRGSQHMQLAIAQCNLRRFDEARAEIAQAIRMQGDQPVRCYDLLLQALVDTLDRGCADQFYAAQRAAFDAAAPAERTESLRCHLIDLELYGQRGLLANWSDVQAVAAQLMTQDLAKKADPNRAVSQ